ncbi:hypothetical protein EON81_29490 [bacterium]|nr:MAG: hypothetical protein EON81_29490 [bacterium]
MWGTQPYMKSYALLVDPSDPKDKSLWPDWMDKNTTLPISYAANARVKWNGSANQAVGVINMPQDWYAGPYVVSQTGVNRVSETIMFASRYFGQNLWGGGALITGITDWDFSGPQAVPNPTRDGTPYTVTSNGKTITVNKDNRFGAVAVYGDQGIFAFTDGHAKSMNPIATNPDEKNLPAEDVKNMWNYTRS